MINKSIGKIILILLVLIFPFCKKDEIKNYQTIYPLPYLPAYPGSYWVYSQSNNTITVNASDEYVLTSFKSNELQGTPLDSFYAPVLNNLPWGENNFFVVGYSTPVKLGNHYSFVKILSDSLNDSWSYNSYVVCSRMVNAIDSTVVVNNVTYSNVIIIEDHEEGCPTENSVIERFYFAKNIGLIKYTQCTWVIVSGMNQYQVDYNWDLIDYHINK